MYAGDLLERTRRTHELVDQACVASGYLALTPQQKLTVTAMRQACLGQACETLAPYHGQTTAALWTAAALLLAFPGTRICCGPYFVRLRAILGQLGTTAPRTRARAELPNGSVLGEHLAQPTLVLAFFTRQLHSPP